MTSKNGTITCQYEGQSEITPTVKESHSFIDNIICDIIDKVDEIASDIDKNFEFIPCPVIDKSYIKVNDFLDTIEENSVSVETETDDVLQVINDSDVLIDKCETEIDNDLKSCTDDVDSRKVYTMRFSESNSTLKGDNDEEISVESLLRLLREERAGFQSPLIAPDVD
ncbi:unnamed protein product [Leptosia nina]|uniref:Uncharacterized protein n=1 Tax=Leptosia nina TaxID=320188 RepID=A0AAV1JKL2_9NEOP